MNPRARLVCMPLQWSDLASVTPFDVDTSHIIRQECCACQHYGAMIESRNEERAPLPSRQLEENTSGRHGEADRESGPQRFHSAGSGAPGQGLAQRTLSSFQG